MPSALPKARSDLEYFEQQIEGEDVVIVRDPLRNQYFKYNPLQAAMLRSLDGVRTVQQMINSLSLEYDIEIPRASADRFIARARDLLLLEVSSSESDAETDAEVMRVLARKGLRLRELAGPDVVDRIHSAEAALFVAGLRQLQAGRPAAAADYFEALLEHRKDHKQAQKLLADIQAAYIKVLAKPRNSDFQTHPVFDPYRLLTFLDRLFGKFLFGPLGVLLLLGLVVGAGYSYSITSYPDLHASAFGIAMVVFLVFAHDLAHELAHGWACVHYGGAVHEIGVAVIFYVSPAFYCDTSSTYLMTEKRHRLIVQAAGTIGSLFVLSVMLIALAVFSPTVFFYTPVQIALWYIVPFTVMNFIPLLKLDGYYALCDYLGVTNLRDRSIGLLKARLSRLLLGLDTIEEELPPAKQRLFLIFASAAVVFTALWLYFVTFGFLVWVVERLRGPGLVISAFFLYKLLRSLVFEPGWQLAKLCYRKRRRVFTIKRSLVLAALAASVLVPWTCQTPVRVDATFELVPEQRAIVRVQTDGFVDRVLVHEGDHVQRGQVLAKLRTPELDHDAGALADPSLLTIESPIDGVIVTKRFEDSLGKYVAQGDPLLEVVDTSSFYAEIHVPADEPLDEIAAGNRVVLQSYGAPGTELGATIDHMRSVAAGNELVIVTTPFTAPGAVAGMEGHARMFGRTRSLAYSMLYVPFQRIVRVKLWSML